METHSFNTDVAVIFGIIIYIIYVSIVAQNIVAIFDFLRNKFGEQKAIIILIVGLTIFSPPLGAVLLSVVNKKSKK